ncbi:MAG: AAA family ATPase [Glaciecola sp.]|nr:AAA family ATPase [Glaciecola sp.]
MSKRDFYIRESELDDFQTKVIERRTDKSFIVKGCAGSGKSILALWKIKQIQERKLGTYTFIVFTKALRRYMEDGIKAVGLDASNIDYHYNWKKNKKVVDYIVVDEAQDFTEEEIKEFSNYAKKALLLYGDSAQQLYAFKTPPPISIEDIEYITKFPSEQLVFNHRLPKKVARLAQHLNSSNDDLESRCKNEGNIKPKIVYFKTINAQLDKIIEMIKNARMDDVGILFRYNAEIAHAAEYFENNGLDVEMKVNQNMEIDFNSTKPKLLTYHSSKGTQFQNVFIPICQDLRDDYESALYVAMTRTYEGLYIFYSQYKPSVLDDLPKNVYESSIFSTQKFEL